MSPQEFGSIISRVHSEFYQPTVATLLAQHIRGCRHFTCQYAAEVVKECNRSVVATQLTPMRVDPSTHHCLIRSELKGVKGIGALIKLLILGNFSLFIH
jgi:hypothetical protein